MNENEHKYVTHDLELEVIIHALNMSKYYLLGKRFTLMSDQNGLQYLFDKLNQNGRQDWWLAMIIELDFEIYYIKGKENRVVDSLSSWV